MNRFACLVLLPVAWAVYAWHYVAELIDEWRER
jgi:hypothetical protein